MPAEMPLEKFREPDEVEVEQVIPVDTSTNRAALADAPRTPGGSKSDAILVADNVRRTFGGLTAVDVAHVEIQRGVITVPTVQLFAVSAVRAAFPVTSSARPSAARGST